MGRVGHEFVRDHFLLTRNLLWLLVCVPVHGLFWLLCLSEPPRRALRHNQKGFAVAGRNGEFSGPYRRRPAPAPDR
mgnify:CR=1 FL=1